MAEVGGDRVAEQSVIDPADLVSLEAIDITLPEEEIIPKLMNNLLNVGFLTIKNVPDYEENDLYRAVRAFYKDIPASEHRKLIWHNHNPENSNVFRGLTPFVDNDPAHKEMYDMGCSMKFVSEKCLPIALYEDTPFPP